MAERNTPAATGSSNFREAVCIHTNKIFDSCKDKDCVEDLRVYPTRGSQAILDNACSCRPRSATLLHADVRVDEINFNRGCYTCDVTYFYRIIGEVFPGELEVTGLAIFEKRVILYGSEGGTKVFSSTDDSVACSRAKNLPTAVVEAVDPLALSMKLVCSDCDCNCNCGSCCNLTIPNDITACFGDALITDDTERQLYVTLGQFSTIRLERETQLLIPAYDYCIPDRECAGAEDDPCSLFATVPFPVDDFFPPATNGESCTVGGNCGCCK